MGFPTPRPTTLGVRLGLEGPRRGCEELGRKREGKEEREGQSNKRQKVKNLKMRLYLYEENNSSTRALGGHLCIGLCQAKPWPCMQDRGGVIRTARKVGSRDWAQSKRREGLKP